MGKLVVSEFVSVDGVMEAPGGEPGYAHTGWVARYPHDWFDSKLAEIQAAEALLVGRVSYESFAGAWPQRTGAFAEKLNGMPKYVVSTTLRAPAWNNTTVLEGDVGQSVAALKRKHGGDIVVHGSRTLVHTLRQRGLVDEWRLLVFPIVLGSGARLFGDHPDASMLDIVEHRQFGSGATLLVYRPRPAAAS
jgi:dihydrofolate reductase